MKRKEGIETYQYEHERFLLLRKAEAAGSFSLASPGYIHPKSGCP